MTSSPGTGSRQPDPVSGMDAYIAKLDDTSGPKSGSARSPYARPRRPASSIQPDIVLSMDNRYPTGKPVTVWIRFSVGTTFAGHQSLSDGLICGCCRPFNSTLWVLVAVGARSENRNAFGDRRVVIHRDNLAQHRLEIRHAPKITQRRARARAVGGQWPSTIGQIIDVDSAKIDAPACERCLVAHGRMQMRGREQDDTARRHDQAHARLEFEWLLGARLHPCIAFHMLPSILPAIGIPAIVVEIRRTVLDGCAPVARMERHPLTGVEVINRHPPVQLARRRRKPGISMRMMGISNPGGQIVGRIGNAQARHILKGLMRVTSHIHKQALQTTSRPWIMDEMGLEPREDFHRLRHRKLPMRMLRMARREC